MTKLKVVLLLLFSLLVFNLAAQNLTRLKQTDSIPIDFRARYGKLSNGFTYYLQKNDHPDGEIVIYFVVRAGFSQEDPDQQELSHLLEHMAFEETSHYSNVTEFLEGHGVVLGDGMNASTHLGSTAYRITIPSKDTTLFGHALKIVRDWADGILLKPNALVLESKVVREELRRKEGALQNSIEFFRRSLLNNSKYHRTIAGSVVILESFDPESIIRFYKDWYRPDLEAIVVVGDINPDGLLTQVQNLFGSLKTPPNSRRVDTYLESLSGKNRFFSMTDDLLTEINVQILMKHKSNVLRSKNDYRRSLSAELYHKMMRSRLLDSGLAQDQYGKWPNVSSYVSKEFVMPNIGLGALVTTITLTNPDSIRSNFQQGYKELLRVKKYGFSKYEFEGAKNVLRAEYKSKTRISSVELAQRYVDNFSAGAAAPNFGQEMEMIQSLIKDLTLEEINVYVDHLISDVNRDITITAPKKYERFLPDEAELSRWISELDTVSLQPYVQKVPFIDSSIVSGYELSKLSHNLPYKRSEIKELGITKLVLGNGVTVILKPFKPNTGRPSEVLLHGISSGGALLYAGADYLYAKYSSKLVNNSALESFDSFLKANKIAVQPYVRDQIEGIKCSSPGSAAAIEIMLKTVYRCFNLSGFDEKAYKGWLESQASSYEVSGEDLTSLISQNIKSFVLSGTPLEADKLEIDKLSSASPVRSFELFKERFANAGDFTFVMTGDFQQQQVIPIINKYLGSLKSSGKREVSKIKIPFVPKGGQRLYLPSNEANKGRVAIHFKSLFSDEQPLTIALLERVLSQVIFQELREQQGGTYSPVVRLQPSENVFNGTITFQCAPDRVDSLLFSSLRVIRKIRDGGPDENILQKAAALEISEMKRNLTSNEFWLQYLISKFQSNGRLDEILHFEENLKKVTSRDIRLAAEKYLADNNLIVIVDLPIIDSSSN